MTSENLIDFIDTYVEAVIAHATVPQELAPSRKLVAIAHRKSLVLALNEWRSEIVAEARSGSKPIVPQRFGAP
jgi:hypothetical protein